MNGLLRAVNSVLPRRVSGTGRPEIGNEIGVEGGQRCAWIGIKWYPSGTRLETARAPGAANIFITY